MFKTKSFVIIVISSFFFTSPAKSNTDTSIIRYYLKKAENFCSTNTDSALVYSRKALIAAPSVNNPYFVSQIYKTQGMVFYYQDRYDSAEHYYYLAIKLIPKNKLFDLAAIYNIYGAALMSQNKFDTSLYYLQKSFEINNKLKFKRGLMSNYSTLGNLYRWTGAFDISSRYLYLGLPIAEELKDTLQMIKFFHIIGINYYLMKNAELAIFYCKKAFDYSLKIKNYEEASKLINTIANSNADLNQNNEALRNYKLSYDYAHRVNSRIMESAALANIGYYYTKKNQFDSAIFYLAKGKSIAQKINYHYVMTGVDIAFGEIYIKTKQYNLALNHLLHVIENKNIIENALLVESYLQLSKLYEAMGNYAKAYKYHVIYSLQNDSAINKQKLEEIANIKMQYELTKKQEQMDEKLLAETDRYKLLRNIIIIGFFATIVIAALVVISYRFRQKQKLYNLKNEINSYRQRLMTQQMNPHFIFNMLSSIQYFIYNNKKEESMDFVSQFAQLMRLNLYNSQNDIIALKDELEALKLYLELERIRLDNKFDYTIEIDAAIDIEKQLVPSFLIQPLVENSIKHGILSIEQRGNIQAKISYNNGSLIYSVIDNGVGFEKSKANQNATKHISYGLDLTKKRLSLIGILNNKKTDFTVTDIKEKNGECSGTKVELVIPSSLRFI